MQKYIRVAKDAWDEMLTYRLSFLMWRVRNIFQLLTIYFLWNALLPSSASLAGYNRSLMITYVLGTSLMSSIVWSSKTIQVGDDINEGNLSNFLLKPMSYITYWFAKDIGDKTMNVLFSLIELTLFVILFHPPLFLQTNIGILLTTFVTTVLATILYFFLNFLMGLIAFWNPETWAPRFLLFNLMTFFAGNLFPLDILPKPLYLISQLLPFQYMLYFPIKMYLGQLPFMSIVTGLTLSIIWTVLLAQCVRMTWKKGLQSYAAYGQ